MIGILNSNPTAFDGMLMVSATGTDGYTLRVNDNMSLPFRTHFVALGGSDITNVKSGRFTWPAVTGSLNITGVGFQPDIVFFTSSYWGTLGVTTNSDFSFGAAIDSTHQGILTSVITQSTPTSTISYCTDQECVTRGSTSTPASLNGRGKLLSMDADGFTLSFARVGTGGIQWLAIKGGKWAIGSLNTSTTVNTKIQATGLGFKPRGAMLLGHGNTKSALGTGTGNWVGSFGAFDYRGTNGVHSTFAGTALPTGSTTIGLFHNRAYLNVGFSGSSSGQASMFAMEDDGFILNMDVADNKSNFVWYVAAGVPRVSQRSQILGL